MTPLIGILLALLLVVIACPRLATAAASKLGLWPHVGSGEIHFLPFVYTPQITVDVTTAGAKVRTPWACRVIKAWAAIRATGGTTPHTDIDAVFKNESAADAVIATVPAVDASTIAAGGAYANPASETVAVLGDGHIVRCEIDITGGSSPTADGFVGGLWVERLG